MTSLREEVFLSYSSDNSAYQAFSKKEKHDFQIKWLQQHDQSLTQLSKKAKDILRYLAGNKSSVARARSDFSQFIHHSHPYLAGLLRAIPMLHKPLGIGDHNEKVFKETMELIAKL